MKMRNYQKECFDELYSQIEAYRVQGAPMDVFSKCIVIAFRVLKGENVCPKDNSFLFENYPAMHYRVWSMRTDLENLAAC